MSDDRFWKENARNFVEYEMNADEKDAFQFLNRCGQSWTAYKDLKGNPVEWEKQVKKVENAVVKLIFERCRNVEDVGDLWILMAKELKHYDPMIKSKETGQNVTLGAFVSSRLRQRMIDLRRRERRENRELPEDDSIIEIESNSEPSEEPGEIVEDGMTVEAIFVLIMTMLINFKMKKAHQPGPKNEFAELYQRMCYTEQVVWAELQSILQLKEKDINFQKDVLKAMLWQYYDYWTMPFTEEGQEKCLTHMVHVVEELVTSAVKKLPWKDQVWWLEARIPMGYMKDRCGKEITDKTVSDFRKHYIDGVKELLVKEGYILSSK